MFLRNRSQISLKTILAGFALLLTFPFTAWSQTNGPTDFRLQINPDQVVQGETDLEFTAQAPDNRELVSFRWFEVVSTQELGDTQSISLAPNFPFTTLIACEATDAEGAKGLGFATILVEGTSLEVGIDPNFVSQEEGVPINFAAVVPDDVTIESYTWRRADTGELLGTEATLTLDPIFQISTEITLVARDDQGNEGLGLAFIEVPFDDPFQSDFRVTVDPDVAYLGDEPITFSLLIDNETPIASYEWKWFERNEVLGNSDSLTLQPDPANVGTIIVRVTDTDGNVGVGFALVLPEGPGRGDITVTVDPQFVVQGEDPFTLTANAQSSNEIESYTWTNDNTGEILGTDASITLDPLFTEPTIVSVTVVDVEGASALACAIVTLENVPFGEPVFVSPGAILQEDEPMTFEAIVDPALEVTSYTWTNRNTQEIIGTESSITLEATFEVTTTIGLQVTTSANQIFRSEALILLGDVYPGLTVTIDPELQPQREDPMTFTATVEGGVGDLSYEWIRQDTLQVIGDGPSVTVNPDFENTTPIGVTVVDSEGDRGSAWAMVLVNGDTGIGDPYVLVDPNVVYQRDEPLTLNAWVENAIGDPTFTWFNDTTGEELGTGTPFILQPTLEETTNIRVDAEVDGQTLSAWVYVVVTPERFNLSITPPAVIQNGQEVTFQAVYSADQTITSFEWRNQNNGEVLGTESSLTLTPDFDISTTIALIATNDEGTREFASSLILVDDQGSEFFPSLITPAIAIQGVEPLTFTAQVPDTVTPTSYVWRNANTDQILGTEATMTAPFVFQEFTLISLEIQAEGNRESRTLATVLVYDGGVDPNGDGVNSLEDMIFEASTRWMRDADVRNLSTINTGN